MLTEQEKRKAMVLLVEKGLHVHVLTEEDAVAVYADIRKRQSGRMPGYQDTHYVMNSDGDITYIGWLEGVYLHAFSYKPAA